ncbi:hypothetical protein L6R53_13575 [Myxococcota bacterium]|nr:hypothetical protein [Myxococcota bacterium]
MFSMVPLVALLAGCSGIPDLTSNDEKRLCRSASVEHTLRYRDSDLAGQLRKDKCSAKQQGVGEEAAVVVDMEWDRSAGGLTAVWRRAWTGTARFGTQGGWALDTDSYSLAPEWRTPE